MYSELFTEPINARTLSVVTRVNHNNFDYIRQKTMSFFFLNPHSKCFMFRKQLHHKSKLKLPRCKIQDKIIYSQSISKKSSKTSFYTEHSHLILVI